MHTPAPFRHDLAPAAEELQRQARTWLLIALASIVLCLSLFIGVGAAVFCYLALRSAEQGALADAEQKLLWGKVLTAVGSAIGVASTALSVLLRG
jgi:hypothetical protein